MKHKQWASLAPFILVSFCSSASTVNNYLSLAKENPVNLTLGNPAKTSENWRGSYSDNKELRIEDNGTSLSFRMRPKYGSERDIERTVFSESERQNQLYADQVMGNDLRSRYSDIIDMLAIELGVREFQDRCSLLKLETTAESARSESLEFDAVELQDLMLDLEHCETQLNLATQKLVMVRSRLNIIDGHSQDAFINNLITPEQIKLLIQSKKNDVKNPKEE